MSRRPAPFVAVLDPTSPAAVAGLHSLDRITRIGGQQVKYFSDVEHALATASGPTKIEYLRPSLLPLPGANLSSMLPGEVTVTIDPATHATGIESVNNMVSEVEPGSPAELAGLKRFDKLLSANGQPLLSWGTLERIRAESKGTPIALEVLRDGQKLTVTLTQKAHEVKDELGQLQAAWQFGAQPETTDEPGELIPLRYPASYCLAQALNEVPKNIGIVAGGLWGMFNGKVALDQVGGPGMLYDIASRSSEAGASSFFAAMAIISINLGIMNLLPIPVLDGFHILSAGFEWIRRRPLSLRTREYANLVGLVMLLGLMAFAIKNDIVRLVMN
jgi:regulator of sigma E protease